jgi:hypothetical protein
MLQLAEVKDTSIAFKPFKDDLGDEWPLGTIKVQLLAGGLNERARFEYAIPATFCRRMPVIGEHVILVKAASYFALGAGSNITRFYYLDPVSIQGSVNYNILPESKITFTTKDSGYTKATVPTNEKTIPFKPGENFKEANVKQLQPFEGETLIEGRFGNSIRLGTSYTNYNIYQTNPTFKTNNNGAPILILRNGTTPSSAGKTYTTEDIDKDNSSIYLTSVQQLTSFKASQRGIGAGTLPLTQFNQPQIALSSNRIVLNAKTERILLISKTDVIIATPKWQIQMDRLVTLIETFITEVNKVLTSPQPVQVGPTGTGTVSPAVNTPLLVQILAELKTMKQI